MSISIFCIQNKHALYTKYFKSNIAKDELYVFKKLDFSTIKHQQQQKKFTLWVVNSRLYFITYLAEALT